ncbi:protoporphyrinogen oxidase HemJ [Cognatiyoonia sp.]|uniref:protoporphyrinogen oxidase HemJ n=1 Tax=Cognatiyoonia sp. TaxID=2211652 RepID=UPI003F695BBB
MSDLLHPFYDWLKAFHIIAVISWMAGMFYLPRLFVYHAEKAEVGSDLDTTFQTMELKLLKVIMNPAMVATWVFGLLLIALGGFDFVSAWAWIKLVAVIAMTGMHGWLSARRKDFAAGTNQLKGSTYRLMNEVPTVLMFIIVIFVIVRPF